MPSPSEITISQLSRLLGTSEAPVIIDVRLDDDFDADARLLPCSIRWDYRQIPDLKPRLAGRKVVVLCQKGLKLSQGAAALLRTSGVAAETLEGGFLAWREAGEPLVPVDRIPARNPEGHTLWVTRHRPKIDRLACPWLIRRFIDPGAVFLFVAPSEVMPVSEHFGATPFDIENAFWSHRGDKCSFDTMLDEFGLDAQPLRRLARIIRGADTNRLDLEPESAGLLAASLGLSRMYRDDLAQLDAGMILYDSFYRWVRDAVDEGHDWPIARDRGY